MKKIKPDEYFSNGLIEAARFGNTVVTHNNMTEDLHKEWISGLADHYTEEKEKIDVIIEKIKENKLCISIKEKDLSTIDIQRVEYELKNNIDYKKLNTYKNDVSKIVELILA